MDKIAEYTHAVSELKGAQIKCMKEKSRLDSLMKSLELGYFIDEKINKQTPEGVSNNG